MKRLFNDRKTLYFVLGITLVCIFTLTIAYAALSTVLEITGNAEVAAANWDIYLDNVKVDSGSVESTVPIITSATTASFSATLNNPGDYYQFTIDVVNDGSIDAMIDSVIKTPELTSEQAKYINYIVEYENGEAISTKQLVSADSFVRLKVRVEYRKDVSTSDLPSSSTILDLSFIVNYTQSDGSGSSVTDNGIQIVSANGDINEIGTIVTIGSEQFYTIGIEGDNVKLFSMMNITLGDNPIQSEDAETTPFSIENNLGLDLSYYSNSKVKEYVDNYKYVLESYDILVVEARLLSHYELNDSESFFCESHLNKCSDKYSWIYSTTYWTGYDNAYGEVYRISSDGTYSYSSPFLNNGEGVRPVIVISKNYFN